MNVIQNYHRSQTKWQMCISILHHVGHEFIKRYTVHKKRTPKSGRLIVVRGSGILQEVWKTDVK